MSDTLYEKHIHNQNGWVCEKIQIDPMTGEPHVTHQQCMEPNAPTNVMGTKVYLDGQACARKTVSAKSRSQ